MFDWTQVRTKEEWERLAAQRDAHAFAVVEKEVLAKGRRALLVFGSSHLVREGAYARADRKPQTSYNLTELLERKHPGSVFAIWVHSGDWGAISTMDERLAPLPKPCLIRLRDTWLGRVAVGEPGTSPMMADLADALLYLGPGASQTESEPADAVYDDPAYFDELRRRDSIQGGFNRSELDRLAKKRRN